MANTQNASFQMLVLPDRHHFYTALAFHISSYIFHISSILDTRQTSLPLPFLFFLVYLFIYSFLFLLLLLLLLVAPFFFSFLSFDSRYLFYRIISRLGGKSFFLSFFSLFLLFQVHSTPVHFHSLEEINVPSEYEFPSLSLSFSRGELLIVA